MVYIDSEAPDPSMEPGIDLWKVIQCEHATAQKSGAPMFKIKLARCSNSEQHMYDIIMLGGPGRKYGIGKLRAILATASIQGDIDPLDLVGKRVWVATKIEVYTNKQGQDAEKLAVNSAVLRCGGYQPEQEVPDGYSLPAPTGWDVGNDPWEKPATPTQVVDDIKDIPF